ncbi:DinB family protein [Lysinibacillus fusiformis]|uniref:DinB family protein n=1 Tax=Lysinibacillus fusiformis TaxID=28031 RepID=UPI00046952F1|nr:DinB family protein [Lysinibacillus fusiformis]
MLRDKKSIIKHYEQSLIWVKELRNLSEDQWRMPIESGKWSVSEVIGHLTPWDTFVLEHRIPYLFINTSLPKGPDIALMNTKAAEKSREQHLEKTIIEFVLARRQLLQTIQQFTDEQWQQSFSIGQSNITIEDYFGGLIDHDLHHFSQIQNVLDV